MAGIATQVVEEQLKKMNEEIAKLRNQKSPVDPFTMITKLEYSEATPIIQRDNGEVYDTLLFTAPSTNSATVYIGSSNPAYPLTAGSSITFRKKRLIGFYAKGTVGDQLIISA